MDIVTGTTVSHILILEGDRAHQDLVLHAFLADPKQFRVSIAGNLRDARDIIGRDQPDLIIANWILPDGKGLDILPRKNGRVTIPLVIMTSHGDEPLAVEIMKYGAIDYVVKSATTFRDLPHIARRALRDWDNLRERKRAEEAVRNSQKLLADILRFLPDAVLAIDNEGRMIAWNKAIEEMTGVAAADMLGKGDHEYSIPLYGERRPILIDFVFADDADVREKYHSIRREGNKIISELFVPAMYGGREPGSRLFSRKSSEFLSSVWQDLIFPG
ncbi:MAG: response regulator [Methanoregula sp.]